MNRLKTVASKVGGRIMTAAKELAVADTAYKSMAFKTVVDICKGVASDNKKLRKTGVFMLAASVGLIAASYVD